MSEARVMADDYLLMRERAHQRIQRIRKRLDTCQGEVLALRQERKRCRAALYAAKDAIEHGPDTLLSDDELNALELIEEVLG